MARGWESKSVESQQDDRGAARDPRKPEISAQAREREDRKHALELSRARIVAQLDTCRSDAHRASLESALAFLDTELQRLA